jgi:hypothetical protein
MSLIGDSAFEGCSELKDVNLGDSENVIIGDRAFKGCGSINTIELPENINVGESVFEDCPAIDFKQEDYKIIQSSGKTELL